MITLDIPENMTQEKAHRVVSGAEQKIADLLSRFGADAFQANTVPAGTRDESDHSLHMTYARAFARTARDLFEQGDFGAAWHQATQANLRAIQAEGALTSGQKAA